MGCVVLERGLKSPVMDPFDWVFESGWEGKENQEHIETLRDRCDHAGVWFDRGDEAPFLALVEALRVFVEESRGVASSYREMGLPVLKEVCHAIFGWDVLLSLTVNEKRSRRFLLLGETGTGKEAMSKLIGKTVMRLHGREGGAGQHVSAANFLGDTLRSEIFGHLKGAFTGAIDIHRGILGRMRDGDYLFIDEIGEASLAFQQILLRTIQEHEFRPVGASQSTPRRFHLIAATNQSEWSLRAGQVFRSDLYYRLASPQLRLPPLREILEAAKESKRHIFKAVVHQVFKEDLQLAGREEVLSRLKLMLLGKHLADATERTGYGWPGNFRELRNVIQHLIYTGSDAARTTALIGRLQAGQSIGAAAAQVAESTVSSDRPLTMAELKRAAYERACAGNYTVTAVAKELDVSRQTAHERIKAYGFSLAAR
jgi:transcriptional regulator with PAS, ATPase and Fis domain